jgi:hypothetical protein
MTRTLLCSCNGTMSPGTAGTGEKVHTALCRFEMGSFLKAAQGDSTALLSTPTRLLTPRFASSIFAKRQAGHLKNRKQARKQKRCWQLLLCLTPILLHP